MTLGPVTMSGNRKLSSPDAGSSTKQQQVLHQHRQTLNAEPFLDWLPTDGESQSHHGVKIVIENGEAYTPMAFLHADEYMGYPYVRWYTDKTLSDAAEWPGVEDGQHLYSERIPTLMRRC